MSIIPWGQRIGSYCVTQRQINKVKGYDVTYFNDIWGVKIGFVKTMKDAKTIILAHMGDQK